MNHPLKPQDICSRTGTFPEIWCLSHQENRNSNVRIQTKFLPELPEQIDSGRQVSWR